MDDELLQHEGLKCALPQARENGLAASSKKIGYRFVKRAFDIVFSAGVVVVGLIPGVILSIFVAKDTGGSPLYVQKRVGLHGKDFNILKFRTMVADADNVEKYLNEEQLATWHAERKVENDPRITPLGMFLRKTSIDEFPQFLNVLAGQMAIVGPRAITHEELNWYSEAEQEELLDVLPGITGLWQTGPRNDYTFEEGLRQQLELSYVRNASLGLDAKLFFRTFGAMAKETGR